MPLRKAARRIVNNQKLIRERKDIMPIEIREFVGQGNIQAVNEQKQTVKKPAGKTAVKKAPAKKGKK